MDNIFLEDLDEVILARMTLEFNRGTPPAEALKIVQEMLQKRARASRVRLADTTAR